jgi:hypothetical protein
MSKPIGFIILMVSLVLVGCSQGGPKSDVKLGVSLGALTTNLSSSSKMYLKMVNNKTNAVTYYELSEPYVVKAVPTGSWSLYIVITSASDWSGPYTCGGIEGVNFAYSQEAVDITVSSLNCGSDPYLAMISSKYSTDTTAKWDQANWDSTATWGP